MEDLCTLQSEWISFITNYAESQEEKLNWVTETKEGGVSASLLTFTALLTCIYIGNGEDDESCGTKNNPCLTLKYALNRDASLTQIQLLSSSTPYNAESEGIELTHLPYYLIGGVITTLDSVQKYVSDMSDVLFTLIHCENVTFSSIAFIIQSSLLSHSIFFCTFSSLTLSSISITPSDSTTPIQLSESLIVCSVCSNVTIRDSTFESVAFDGGNGSVIDGLIGVGLSFVVVNSTFSHCSAMYGGAIYLNVSGEPLMIEMSDVLFEGKGNKASKGGNTVYVVWRSRSNMESNQFSSFVNSSEEEAMVEMWNGEIVRLGELVSGGSGSGSGSGSEGEGKNQFMVCTYVKMEENNTGTVVVAVVDEEEGGEGGEGCVVGMEGGEIEGEVIVEGSGIGEVNGEEVVVEMGKELTRVLQECENIEIVMNVTYSGSNG